MPDFNFVPSGEPVRTKQELELFLVSMPVSIKVAAGAHRPDLLELVAMLGLPTPEKRRSRPLVALLVALLLCDVVAPRHTY